MFQLQSHLANCSPASNASSPGQPGFELSFGLVKGCFVLLGAVNLVLNCLCFFVFLCHRQRETTVRLLLLILSFNEMLTSFGMTSVETVRILAEVVPTRVRYPSAMVARGVVSYLTVTWVIANAFLMARNWSVVLIAVSRCEAVLRPFSRNTGRFFSHRTIVVTSAAIVLLGLASAVPKAFQEKFHYCQDTGLIFLKDSLEPFPSYVDFCIVMTFLQAVLPVLIVAVASIAMTVGLRRSRGQQRELRERRSDGGGGGAGGGGGGAQHSKATRTIQILLVAFVCMETPMFLTVLVGTRVKEGSQVWDTAISYAIHVANLCINLDSTCNFIIYMTTNSMFRSALVNWRCCGHSDAAADRRLGGWTTTRGCHHMGGTTATTTRRPCPNGMDAESAEQREKMQQQQQQPLLAEQQQQQQQQQQDIITTSLC